MMCTSLMGILLWRGFSNLEIALLNVNPIYCHSFLRIHSPSKGLKTLWIDSYRIDSLLTVENLTLDTGYNELR
ncbi:hypothetical protein QVD17_03376 [Tagetes erecta]|uniref:Uncharacterized protein n=1 Tax=Tagetes erecta TaxID=13708 RepID=A0AAD8P9V7_TARER|nr:hypothetical protein QVD17_03376 [Tagetes erecta]